MFENWLSVFTSVTFNEKQVNLIREIKRNRFLIVKKPRQAGATTAYLMYLTYLAWSGEKVLLCPAKRSMISLDKIRMISERFALTLYNDRVKFPSSGEFIIGGFPMIGKKLDLILFDEFAFLQNAEESYKAAFPCIMERGKMVISSTPHMGSYFDQLYQRNQ